MLLRVLEDRDTTLQLAELHEQMTAHVRRDHRGPRKLRFVRELICAQRMRRGGAIAPGEERVCRNSLRDERAHPRIWIVAARTHHAGAAVATLEGACARCGESEKEVTRDDRSGACGITRRLETCERIFDATNKRQRADDERDVLGLHISHVECLGDELAVAPCEERMRRWGLSDALGHRVARLTTENQTSNHGNSSQVVVELQKAQQRAVCELRSHRFRAEQEAHFEVRRWKDGAA